MRTIYAISIISIFLTGCATKNIQIDSDNDGIFNYIDVCKETPILAKVDKYGCALDTDNDGVIDLFDKCKKTPLLDIVKADGCSIK
jgi:OOP family OmpA-OmpF porin